MWEPSRRAFIVAATAAPQAFAQQPEASQWLPTTGFWERPRTVWLRHISGEEQRLVYWAQGTLLDTAYRQLCTLLRDRHLGQAMYMSPVLLDVIYGLQGSLQFQGVDRPFVFTSAARFPQTNSRTEGAARDSAHTKGEAIDGSIPGVPLEYLTRLGMWLRGGGVGFYPERNFIHLDSGRLRAWRGS